jgi:hypothetical protein
MQVPPRTPLCHHTTISNSQSTPSQTHRLNPSESFKCNGVLRPKPILIAAQLYQCQRKSFDRLSSASSIGTYLSAGHPHHTNFYQISNLLPSKRFREIPPLSAPACFPRVRLRGSPLVVGSVLPGLIFNNTMQVILALPNSYFILLRMR